MGSVRRGDWICRTSGQIVLQEPVFRWSWCRVHGLNMDVRLKKRRIPTRLHRLWERPVLQPDAVLLVTVRGTGGNRADLSARVIVGM